MAPDDGLGHFDESRHSEAESARRQPSDVQLARCEARFIEAVCTALVEIQERATENMAEALYQLEAGTYGFCLDCLTPIPAERLSAVSFAVRCVTCERTHSARVADEMPDLAPAGATRSSAGRRL